MPEMTSSSPQTDICDLRHVELSSVAVTSLLITLLQAIEGEGEEQVKSRRQAARAAHRRIRIAQSDALNALSAFISWQGAHSREDFCRCATLGTVWLICGSFIQWHRLFAETIRACGWQHTL